ncbi:DNA topoisomerase IV [Maribacter halichondriae]|uniref:DNA topoisomerase IV n=1 Tax=Maribacter halichondriae TaxID=2980554 RepID=UPI00235A2B37|nr:DNA topoisomerase IV [Maribacter sp. Hal144]
MRNLISILLLSLFLSACYQPQRDCADFKNGEFTFTSEINGQEKTTTFVRNDEIEIDYFEQKSDTSSIRWINDCEYIVKKINPKNAAEEKSIHIKILSTTDNSYTFEYNIVGGTQKSKGTAVRVSSEQ